MSEKDPWEGHRVSRPIPLEEEKKQPKKKDAQRPMFEAFGVEFHANEKNKYKKG